MRVSRAWMIALLLVLLVPIIAACGEEDVAEPVGEAQPVAGDSAAAPAATIRVGTKDFTEQFILGHMYALALEDAGFNVELKDNLGGTPIAQAALESNEIDLYPEYTGTGLLTVLQLEDFANKSDAQAVYNAVRDGYQEKYNLTWLEPAPMNNTQALAMTRADADALGITTISEMAAQANQLRMIGPPEFQEREDGLPGIKAAYGNFEIAEYVAVDPGLKYKGLIEDQADVVVAFGTDGEIANYDLVILKDDQGLFPIYQVAPVVRQEVLDANPMLADVLNKVSAKLDDATMQRLNFEVSGNGRDPQAVASEFLKNEGLID